MIVKEGHVGMDLVKLAAIQEWKPLSSVKGVQSFIGFCNFYQKFIPDFSTIAQPLHNLTKKGAKWDWTTECDVAFKILKATFIQGSVLALPDTTKPFMIMTNASLTATGAVLMQTDFNGDLHPYTFLSKTLSAAERNYDIFDQELLAMIHALTEWKYYLQGTGHPVTVVTDHKNLSYFKQPHKLSWWQAQWMLFLQDFDLAFLATLGSQMGPADALSCKDKVDTSNNNQDVVLLPPTLFIKAIDVALSDKIALSSPFDPLVTATLHALDDRKSLFARASKHDWHYDNSKLYFKNRLYIPEAAWQDLVASIHTSEACGHGGIFCTLNLLQQDFWWPGMTTYVQKYVAGCATCQANKMNTHPTIPALLSQTSDCTCPFQQVSVDLITDLPPSGSCDSVMVIVDHGLMKGVILCPCNKNINAAGVAKLFFLHVFHHYSLHDKCISDWGPQFASAFARELTRLLKYDLKISSAYHSQIDGETERVNQELETYLHIFCNEHPKKWADLLPMAEFSHNSATHSTTNKLPFSLILRYELRSYPLIRKTFIPALETCLKALEDLRKEALAAYEKAQRTMKEQISSKFCPWKSGDKIWLEERNLKLHYPSKKLAPRREGPFEIVQVISLVAYKLQLLPTWKIHDVFHASLLSSYREIPEHGPNFSNPPPDLIRGEEEYKIDKILSNHGTQGWRQYLVSWKGYSTAENTWEPEKNLQYAQTLLKAYKLQHLKDFPSPT